MSMASRAWRRFLRDSGLPGDACTCGRGHTLRADVLLFQHLSQQLMLCAFHAQAQKSIRVMYMRLHDLPAAQAGLCTRAWRWVCTQPCTACL